MFNCKQLLLSVITLMYCDISLAMHPQAPRTYSPYVNTPKPTPSLAISSSKQVAQMLWADEAPFPVTKTYNQALTVESKRLVTRELRNLITLEAKREVLQQLKSNPEGFYKNYKNDQTSLAMPSFYLKRNSAVKEKFPVIFREEYKRIGEKLSHIMPALERFSFEGPGLGKGIFDLYDYVDKIIAEENASMPAQ